MDSIYRLVNQLAVLLVGRNLFWSNQAAMTDAPANEAAGVALLDSPRVMLHVALREEPHLYTARILVTAGDAATSYSLSVNGNAITPITGESTIEDVVFEMVAAAGAISGITDLVDITSEDSGSGLIDTIVLKGRSSADLEVLSAATSGTGALTLTKDATTAALRLWALPKGAPGWVKVRDGDFEDLDFTGFLERFDTGGLDRLYVQVYDNDGLVTVNIGPAQAEVS